MKIIKHIFFTFFIISMTCLSCKKDNGTPEPETPGNNNNNNSNQTGTLLFHLHTYIDQNEVDGYNINYTDANGRKISLSKAQFYISDIEVEKLDGTIISLANKIFIKVREIQSYDMGSIPAGNYKSVRFKVGLPSAVNALEPGASNDSVILKRSEMWFNSTPQPDGYVYLNAQGSIDTSADLSDKMAAFIYKIGTNSNYKQVVINQNFGISANQVNYFHMLADYSKLFTGITLDASSLNVSTVSDNAGVLAGKIADNIPAMFISE